MLIRAQFRDAIVNARTCSCIYIAEGENDACLIKAEYDRHNKITLGVYATYERAQEVLEEIVGYHSLMRVAEPFKDVMVGLTKYDDMPFGCYDMPAE